MEIPNPSDLPSLDAKNSTFAAEGNTFIDLVDAKQTSNTR